MDRIMLQKKFTASDDDEFSKMGLLGQENGRFGYLFNPPLRGTKSQLGLGTDQDQGQASCPGTDVSVDFGSESSKVGISAAVPYLELDCNPRVLLNNLLFLEQKVHDLQVVARSMIGGGNFMLDGLPDGLLMQQQMIRANITSIIAQLLSVASRLLPNIQQVNHGSSVAFGGGGGGGGGHGKRMSMPGNLQQIDCIRDIDEQMRGKDMEFDFSQLLDDDLRVSFFRQPTGTDLSEAIDRTLDETKLVLEEEIKRQGLNQVEKSVFPFTVSENGSCKDVEVFKVKGVMKEEEEEEVEEEELILGTYELLELDKDEILAPHSHFCTICGKGFKRDANLRMHMRGHGDEYKTPEALAKPNKDVKPENTPVKRYSCPFAGCKRNQKHKKFQPLKTILCVKNHYKRSHCDKSYICSRCHSKKFSVLADLKTHEKHCGQDKWQCSCGTTFSRKDKLFGHVALFQGHTPAIPTSDVKPPAKTDEGSKTDKAKSLHNNLPSNSEEGFANLNSSMKYENETSLLENDAIRCGINFSDEMRSSDLFTSGSSSIIQRYLQSTNGLPADSITLQALLSGNFSHPDGRSLNPNGL